MSKAKASEALLWSIAFPGFGQFLNRKFLKGVVFLVLEFFINVHANLNTVIIYSFQGEIQKAIEHTNYQWLMFYPCVYMFAMWDAYRDARGPIGAYSFLPFVFAAYIGTVGLIYSGKPILFGVVFGPIWLPILSLFIGAGVGLLLKKVVAGGQLTKKQG